MFTKLIKLALGAIFTASISAALFVWFGAFNIAASNKHWDITTSFLEIVRDRSVRTRSHDLTAPNLSDNERLEKAAPNYAAMCAQCHLAPGVEKTELYEGLYPQPPVFYKRNEFDQTPEDVFWIIKNGLKMTGMPAWGKYNSDEQIWDLVAFLTSINKLSPAQYKELAESGEHGHDNNPMMMQGQKSDAEHLDDGDPH